MSSIWRALLPLGALLLAMTGCQRGASSGGDADWPLHGQNAWGQGYAASDQIDTSNVARLGLQWYHQFDVDRGEEATPIMVDGVLYVSTAWSKVHAFDARSGKELWAFDPKVPPETLPKGCCDAVNRGVSVANGRVFVGTFDGRLIALDARSGKQLWSIVTVDQTKPYTITGATNVAKNLVMIGNGGAEYGVRGYVSAYDQATGRLVWRFYTVPNPDGKPDGQPSDKPLRELAEKGWFGDVWRKIGGGGTVWDSMVYDPQSDLFYFGVGNGTPHDHKVRSQGKGDNLFLSSIVAVKATTGEYMWHYQTTPGDSWDYTATAPLILMDRVIDGKPRKLIVQAPKNGFFYVLDRLTGELVSASPFVPVNWATGIDARTGRPIEVPAARYETKGYYQLPGGFGGHSWHPMAFSPQTGLVYIPAQNVGQFFEKDPDFKFRPGHLNTALGGAKLEFPDDDAAIAAVKKASFGELIAWDPVARKARWKVRHRFFMNGGALATAGGLVFQGNVEGHFVAYDAATGQQLWSYETVNGIVAAPISYQLGGRQYVAVMVGTGGFAPMIGTITPDLPRLRGRLMVFALDGQAKAEPYDVPPPARVDLQGVTSTGDPQAGLAKYNFACLVCHGFSATGRYTADLRRSEIIKSSEAFQNVVRGGVLKDLGMVSFAELYSPSDVEDIRAYLIREGGKVERRQNRPPAP
ncbi:PQQ-dependent dehydrogenase, methanol/ethanol family (plasmid) [Rhizorhabdus wittichii]|uniref:PQQ-dependent dehydrogenase, methanol/ethanol family n=1 Tax=Rhizorhabdus wittichii TaxID=160791 RepID=A0A975HGZ7_9SPHN|nr:PQQ-dependent dehydrogenase, methanol/ethanol family [Rhizorhabdus wittichii]QTH24987.1 PQQ-dependent dehydrogenase, methanol/ethanol family [Rhizorhabdus wittichii]